MITPGVVRFVGSMRNPLAAHKHFAIDNKQRKKVARSQKEATFLPLSAPSSYKPHHIYGQTGIRCIWTGGALKMLLIYLRYLQNSDSLLSDFCKIRIAIARLPARTAKRKTGKRKSHAEALANAIDAAGHDARLLIGEGSPSRSRPYLNPILRSAQEDPRDWQEDSRACRVWRTPHSRALATR